MGNSRCQGDRALAGYRTNDSLAIIDISRLQNRIQDSGRAKALGIRRLCRTAPTGLCRARQRSIVKAAALYTNWLTQAFEPVPREVLFLLSAKTHQSRGFSNPYWQFIASVPSATPIFGKLRNLTGLSPREPIQCLLFQLIHACPDYK